MTHAEIKALAAAGESETLELKASTGERVAGAMAVCAMLNHRGGTVLFGVQPNRHASGQKVGDRTIEQLSAALSEIDPPAFPTIEQVRVRGDLSVVVVTVSVGQHQPYSHRGRAVRRVGNTNPGDVAGRIPPRSAGAAARAAPMGKRARPGLGSRRPRSERDHPHH